MQNIYAEGHKAGLTKDQIDEGLGFKNDNSINGFMMRRFTGGMSWLTPLIFLLKPRLSLLTTPMTLLVMGSKSLAWGVTFDTRQYRYLY